MGYYGGLCRHHALLDPIGRAGVDPRLRSYHPGLLMSARASGNDGLYDSPASGWCVIDAELRCLDFK